MNNLFATMICFSGGLSLYIAVAQFVTKNRSILHYIMAFLLICLGIMQVRLYIIITGLWLTYPYLLVLHMPFNFSIGPLLYLYFQALLDSRFRIDLRKVFHFLPAIIILVMESIALIMLTREQYNALYNEILEKVFLPDPSAVIIAVKIIFLSVIVYTAGYQVVIIKSTLSLLKFREMDGEKRVLFSIICASVLSPMFLLLGLITNCVTLITIGTFIISILLMLTYIIAQRQYDMLQHLSLDLRRKRYERSLLKGINIDSIQQRIIELMEEEKVYADDTITLPALAEKLLITPHQLSEFLNERLNMNFNTFINKYRINEAMELLSSDSDLSILQIAYSVGFNSKSVFNTAFQKFTGTTPLNYRKNKTSS